jgi:hypothetical protein
MLHNQTANRSLSKEVLSGGLLPVPVRGELHLDLAPAFQQELTNLIGFAPATATTYSLSGVNEPDELAPTTPSPTIVSDTNLMQPVNATVVTPIAPTSGAEQPQFVPTPPAERRKLQIERPTAEARPAEQMAQPIASSSSDIAEPESEEEKQLRQQLANFEDLARRAQVQLEEERKARQAIEVEMQQKEADSSLLTQHYQEELARLQQHSQETASQSQQAQQQLETLQQQAQAEPQTIDPTQVQQQQTLVNKLMQEEQRSAAFARELIQKMQQSATGASMPAAVPATAQPAAAMPAFDRTKLPVLTNEANVINGFVFDNSGQFVEGAVVVIKDDSGEAKRALKTNKLGQFVVTTPLANGHYAVEADKKGLSLAILNIELTGQPVPALLIQTNQTP